MIFCIIQSVPLSACIMVMHITWNEEHIRYSSEFLCKFWPRVSFHLRFTAESCHKIGFLSPCRLFRKPSIRLHKKVIWASWCPLNYLENQLRAFELTLGRGYVVQPKYSLDVEHLFLNCFCSLRNFTTTLITWKFGCVCTFIFQPLLSNHVTSGLRHKLLVEFS